MAADAVSMSVKCQLFVRKETMFYSRESKFGAILSHENGGLSSCSRELMSEKGWNRTQEMMEYLYNIWLVVSTVFHFP